MSILQIISLGNDIVDLSDPDTVNLTVHEKFKNKVYNDFEREAVFRVPVESQNAFYWKIWAAKEAAYKAIKRLKPDVIFSPKKFAFLLNPCRVVYHDFLCSIHFIENNDYIYAWAIISGQESNTIFDESKFEAQNWIGELGNVEKLLNENKMDLVPSYSRESSQCRNFACLKIAGYIKETGVRLEKDSSSRSSIPAIWINNVKTNHLVSTSHHGRFCAVAFYPKEL